jgi:hypothetical protein
MSNDWAKLINNIEKHLSECPFGEVSLTFIVHSGSIGKIKISHTENYMDISEVRDVAI